MNLSQKPPYSRYEEKKKTTLKLPKKGKKGEKKKQKKLRKKKDDEKKYKCTSNYKKYKWTKCSVNQQNCHIEFFKNPGIRYL